MGLVPYKKSAEVEVHARPTVQTTFVQKNCGLQLLRAAESDVTELKKGEYELGHMRYFEFYGISHMFSGDGIYVRPGMAPVPVRPGDCVIVSPLTVHYYGPLAGKGYCEDAVNFTGPVADLLYRSKVIQDGVFPLGNVRELLPVIKLMNDPSEHAQINAAFELQKVLYEIYNRQYETKRRKSASVIDELLKRLTENPEHWWTIPEMADFCNVSNDQLRRLFLKHTGLLPKVYLDRIKMNHAASMLRDESLCIAEIAGMTGYADPFHFSRRFKAITGQSPAHYRKECRKAVKNMTFMEKEK